MPSKVMQTITSGPDANCFQACLASYFSVPIESIPVVGNDDQWANEIKVWAEDMNLGFMVFNVPNEDYFLSVHRGYSICSGLSTRGILHAVIYRDGRLWHDPHPDSNGIVKVDYVDFFYPLNPEGLWKNGKDLKLGHRGEV